MIYTVASDFHGNAKALAYLLKNYSDTQIVLLGDYFDSNDKGDAKEMANILSKLYRGEYKLKYKPITLRGNHDSFILETRENDYTDFSIWKKNHGKKTLKQLGYTYTYRSEKKIAEFLEREYPDMLAYLKNTEYSHEDDNIIFVHAGLNLDLESPVNDTPDHDKIWLRKQYYFIPGTEDAHLNTTKKTIVSGHTPVVLFQDGDPTVMPLHHPDDPKDVNRYLIDGGMSTDFPKGRVNIVQFDENGTLINTDSFRD